MQQNQQKNNHRPVYVQMHNPSPVRKDVLESAIKTVELMERFEYAREIRAMKREKIKHARTALLELSQELQTLARSIPQAVIRRKEKQVINEARAAENKKPIHIATKKKKSSELKRLESELYEIRSRLSSLNL